MKLQKKEAKRQFLCSTKRSYTPKRGFDQPNVYIKTLFFFFSIYIIKNMLIYFIQTPTNIMTQQDDTCQKPEWQI